MKLKPWTIEFRVNDEVKAADTLYCPTFWTERGATEYAAYMTWRHRGMYGDLGHHVGNTLEYRAVRR